MLGDDGKDGIDNVLTAVGCGWWLTPVFAVVVFANMVPLNMIASTFMSAPMAFRCLPLDAHANHSHLAYFVSNSSKNNSNLAIPLTSWYDSKCLEPSGLERNVSLELLSSSSTSTPEEITLDPRSHATGLPSCPQIMYDRSLFTSTVISEFDLVCERNQMQPLFQIMMVTGALIGCSIIGQVGHSLGCKRAVQLGALLGLPACIGVAFVPWYSAVLLLRMMIGIAGRMAVVGSTSLVMETIPLHYRTIIGMFMGIPTSISTILFSVATYFVREWRYLQLICILPYLLMVPLSFMVEESPRWLVHKGRGQEAVDILMRASKLNSSPIPARLLLFLENLKQETGSSEKRKSEGRVAPCEHFRGALQEFGQYWHSPAMAVIMVVMPLLWFLLLFIYVVITLNVNNFTGTNPFLLFGMMGMCEMVALLVTTPVTHKLGRRPCIGGAAIVSGILFLLEPVVPTELTWVRWILVLSGFFLIGGVWQVSFTYTPELFPTGFRTQGVAMSFWVATTGLMLTPLITDLLVQVVSWGPSVVLGCSSIMVSFFMPLLPETNKRPLPETIQDVEIRHKNKSGKNLTKKSTTPSVI